MDILTQLTQITKEVPKLKNDYASQIERLFLVVQSNKKDLDYILGYVQKCLKGQIERLTSLEEKLFPIIPHIGSDEKLLKKARNIVVEELLSIHCLAKTDPIIKMIEGTTDLKSYVAVKNVFKKLNETSVEKPIKLIEEAFNCKAVEYNAGDKVDKKTMHSVLNADTVELENSKETNPESFGTFVAICQTPAFIENDTNKVIHKAEIATFRVVPKKSKETPDLSK